MGQGGVAVGGDDHPLASSQPVVLDDVRRAEGIERRGGLLRGLAHPRVGGRHSGGAHHVLGEGLRPLQPGGRGGRTEAVDPSLAYRIRDPCDEGRLGTDHQQVSSGLPGQGDDRLRVAGIDIVQGAQAGQPRIPRRDVQGLSGGSQGPAQGMFTPAEAKKQNSGHGKTLAGRS